MGIAWCSYMARGLASWFNLLVWITERPGGLVCGWGINILYVVSFDSCNRNLAILVIIER